MKSASTTTRAGLSTSIGKCCSGSANQGFAAFARSQYRLLIAPSSTHKAKLQGEKMIASLTNVGTLLTESRTNPATNKRALDTFSLLFLAVLTLLLSLSGTSAHAQAGYSVSGQAILPTGLPAANARITVCPYTASGVPCAPQSTIYSDINLTPSNALPQPYAANQYGIYQFYVAPLTSYRVQIQVNLSVTYSFIFTASSSNATPMNLLACVDSSGSATAYVCSTSTTATIAPNTAILFKAGTTSGASPTLAVNGGSAASIVTTGGANVAAGQINANEPLFLAYNGSFWVTSGETSIKQISGGGTGSTTANGALSNLGGQVNLGATQTGAIGPTGTATLPGNLNVSGTAAAPNMTLVGSTGTKCLHEVSGSILPTGSDCVASSMTPHWISKLAAVKAATGNARLLVEGDSTMFGDESNSSQANWVAASVGADVCNDLITYYGTKCRWGSWFGGGSSASYGTFGYSDPRIVLGSAWTLDGTVYSIGGGAYTATTSTNALTFTPTQSVDTFEVYYVQQPSSGVLSVQIDSGTPTLINTAGTAALVKVVLSAGTPGAHTIKHLWSSGGKVDLVGDVSYDSTNPSVVVLLAGTTSATSSTFASNGASYSFGSAAALAVLAPDITVLEDGINDWATSIPVATFTSNMQSVVSALQTAGSDVALYSPIPSNPASVAQSVQAQYVAAYQALAAANYNTGSTSALPYIDNFTAYQSFAISSGYGWRGGDAWHADAAGYQASANLVETALFASSGYSFSVNPSPWNINNPASLMRTQITSINSSGSYTLQCNEGLIIASLGPTITFPIGCPAGTVVQVLNNSGGNPTFTPGTGTTFIGVPASVVQGRILTLWTNGTYWYSFGSSGSPFLPVTNSTASGGFTATGYEGVLTLGGSVGTVTIPCGVSQGTELTVINTSSTANLAWNSCFNVVPPALLPLGAAKLVANGSYWIVDSMTAPVSFAVTPSIGGSALAAGAAASGTAILPQTGTWWKGACAATPYNQCTPDNGGVSFDVKCENTGSGLVVKVIAPVAGTPTACTYSVVFFSRQ